MHSDKEIVFKVLGKYLRIEDRKVLDQAYNAEIKALEPVVDYVNLMAYDFRSAELDRLTTEARVSIDPELRMSLYRAAERIVAQECPVIPLYHERIYAAWRALAQ